MAAHVIMVDKVIDVRKAQRKRTSPAFSGGGLELEIFKPRDLCREKELVQ